MRRLAAVLLFAFTLPGAATAQTTAAPRPAVAVGRLDSLQSNTLHEMRRLLIYTPPSYDSSPYVRERYPVLYLLDGDAHFQSVAGLMQILSTGVNGSYVIPPMIVVGIPNTNRMRDLSPTPSEYGVDGKSIEPSLKGSGGGAAFLRFVKDELIPHIDSTYRTDGYRMLIGHSLGGLMVIDALYTMPETFNAYVAIDPSLWWDRQVLLKQAKPYFAQPGLAGRTLFVGQANTISATDTTVNLHYNSILEFNAVLQAYNRSGIRYDYQFFPDDDHGSVPMIAEYDALRYVFAGYHVDIVRALDDPTYFTTHFAEISRRLGVTMRAPEAMVDQLATYALTRDTTKALALLQLNADNYPDSPHAFTALGDAAETHGEKARALAAFRRVLQLAPTDAHARREEQALAAQR